MVQAADYGVIDPGTYELQNCVVLYRPKGQEHFEDLGDCDSARLEITTTKISRKARNRRVRGVAIEVTTDTEANLTMRAMQFTDRLRAMALLGTPVDHTQDESSAAEKWEHNVLSASVDGLYPVGKLDISGVSVTQAVYDAETGVYTPGAALTADQFKVVDPALGVVQILGGIADGDTIQITGEAPEITAADKRTRIEFMTTTELEGEIIFRGVSDVGTKMAFHLYNWASTPSGIDLIGADDFSGQDLAGKVTVTERGIGTWQKLSA